VNQSSRKLQIWTASAVLAAGTLIGGSVVGKTLRHDPATEMPILAQPVADAPHVGPRATSYAPIIKDVLPDVASVESLHMIKTDDSAEPFFNDPLFQQFFGDQAPNSRAPQERRDGAWALESSLERTGTFSRTTTSWRKRSK
jgi:S1-C subfamily serine protease